MARSVSTLTIRIGLVSAPGKLYPLKASEPKDTKLFMVCPECKGAQMEQFYIGGCGHKPADAPGYKTGDIPDRGKKADDGETITVLTEEEVAEAKGSKLMKGVLELNPEPAAEVDSQTWPSGIAYWFEPDQGGAEVAALFAAALGGEHTFVGEVNLRGSDKFVRLVPHNGGIVVQELLRPQDLNQYAAPSVDVSPKNATLFEALVASVATEHFDVSLYLSDKHDRIRAALAAKEGGEGATVTSIGSAPKKPADDLAAALEAAVAAAQAKKAS